MPMSQQLMLLVLGLLLYATASLAAPSFAGGNAFFLHTLQPSDQVAILDAMRACGMRVVRVFIQDIPANLKGSGNRAVPDVEYPVGIWNDAVLEAIDAVMPLVQARGMKMIIAMHDRYSLGCWSYDAYATKYKIQPTTDCNFGQGMNNVVPFYANAEAAADMDRRFHHIVTHRNALMGNQPWGSLSSVIFGLETQNEPQAYEPFIADPNWICRRGTAMRPFVSNGVLLFSGGGGTIYDSSLPQLFQCSAFDVITLHTYHPPDLNDLSPYITAARQVGKRLFVEELGAWGDGKAASLRSQINTVVSQHLPWMAWSIGGPRGVQGQFESSPSEGASWAALCDGAHAANQERNGAFSWPEIPDS